MDIYIGSTCLPLIKRLSLHKIKNNRGTISKKDLENAEIELIEAYPCNSKKELEQRERWYIENALYCINKVIPGRTRIEHYYANREYMRIQSKKNYEAHKTKRIEARKAYYQANKQSILDKEKERYAKKKLTPS
jgi:hypothetical protein